MPQKGRGSGDFIPPYKPEPRRTETELLEQVLQAQLSLLSKMDRLIELSGGKIKEPPPTSGEMKVRE